MTTIRAIPLDSKNPTRSKLGSLRWRGGIEVIHNEPRFGGISGLDVSADGRRMTAITDRAAWVTAELTYSDGKLSGMTKIKIGNLRGRYNKRLPGRWSDAESLSPDGSGGFLVAFERLHRIWRYPRDRRHDGLTRRPVQIPVPKEFESQPPNGGIEALARLCNGDILALSEELRAGPGTNKGWLRTGGDWSELAYRVKERFRPTGATVLPNCDVVVVERRFNFLSGISARVVRIAADTIKPGATLAGEELALLAPPVNVDNMEGIAARRGENGETLIYIVSDDNFSGIQRTLLLLFELPSGESLSSG